MGIFSKKHTVSHENNNSPVFDANEFIGADGSAVDNYSSANVSGGLKLTKDKAINMTKTPVVTARATWNSSTDYDLYALVLLKDGSELVVSTFGSQEDPTPTPSILNGAVKHNGDVGRDAGGDAQETIEIRMTEDIVAVIPVAYSAQSNGTGSFKRYKVNLEITNGAGETVSIDANNANDNDTVYTVAIGAIVNGSSGELTIKNIESYSNPGSELRPKFIEGKLYMDKGSTNLYK